MPSHKIVTQHAMEVKYHTYNSSVTQYFKRFVNTYFTPKYTNFHQCVFKYFATTLDQSTLVHFQHQPQ